MIRDRGNIKWTAMMLPEHVKELREWQEEDRYKQKPELDEQKLEQMNETVCEAMEFHYALEFHYYDKGQTHSLVGHVHFIDSYNQELRVVDENECVYRVKFERLTDVVKG
ncbi:YolD-like family protein [Pseudalkalibacillus caeni]|uniref:YolD-like family protein n=1 Tax=Exobacillus caeni TaxID=2574798 RepID=A0A5R9F179_9BACL|nr:YolD-like family protein [Pseudalkalibacillus caeni]TLS36429.1 YolD-like family protein [Pseudalkalibacillus caeni]